MCPDIKSDPIMIIIEPAKNMNVAIAICLTGIDRSFSLKSNTAPI